jgi:hypothetical protein
MRQQTEILKLYAEDGSWDLCECIVGDTRVVRVIESSPRRNTNDNRQYAALYAYACGYQD